MLKVGDLAPRLHVQPVFGLPVMAGGRPLVVCFVRSLAGGLARAALEALQEAWPRFDAAGIDVVVVTRCDLTLARDWVPRNHLLVPLVVDSDGHLSDEWQVGHDSGLVKSLVSLRPSGVRALGRALLKGYARPDGDWGRLPADFVIGPDLRLRYVRYGRSVLDQPDLEAIWAAASSSQA